MPSADCAIASFPAEPTATISNDAELQKVVRCEPGSAMTFDFASEWIAVFSFNGTEDELDPMGIRDDGKTVTLIIHVQQHCGGVAPDQKSFHFMYRVPAEPRVLQVHLSQPPPCNGAIP